ncbi:YceD family protein [Raineyella sp. W15-4]|uniref:YceD family protein n=1 Tax=Raineyella sp. W15-4 TaxID=3081651 RepID=UPI00295425B8|nr:YceD family protein [Raineyella sp. W15-4]WOQ18347.1 YceD family protein [Raineyella sp. W15-4]
MTTHRPSAGQLDARSPLVLDTHDLGRRAGALREVHASVPAPEGIGNAVIGIPTGSPIGLDLRLESVSEGVLVSGLATVRLEGECSRCLTRLEDELDVDLQELFVYEDQSVTDDDEDLAQMQGELLDLEPTLRDAVVLDLPFTPLCREDCAGLCPDCGVNLNDEPDHTHGLSTDARWGALSDWAGAVDTAAVEEETKPGNGSEEHEEH